jgi:hypothetical protein
MLCCRHKSVLAEQYHWRIGVDNIRHTSRTTADGEADSNWPGLCQRASFKSQIDLARTHDGLRQCAPTCAAAILTSQRPVTMTRCSRAISRDSTGFILTAAAAICAWLQPSAAASCWTSSGVSGRGVQAYSPAPKLAFSPSHHAADLRTHGSNQAATPACVLDQVP